MCCFSVVASVIDAVVTTAAVAAVRAPREAPSHTYKIMLPAKPL